MQCNGRPLTAVQVSMLALSESLSLILRNPSNFIPQIPEIGFSARFGCGKKMANRPVLEFLLKLINFLLTVSGVSILVFGIYCLIKWIRNSHKTNSEDSEFEAVRSVLLPVDHHQLHSVWFIYLLLAVGTTLVIISCLGHIGTRARSPCCLSSYSALLFGLVLAELVGAAFLLCRQNLNEDMLHINKTGNIHSIYHFIQVNWKIIRWVVLAALILEVVALVLALHLWSKNRAMYDNSDDEFNVYSGSRQGSTNKNDI